MTVSIVRLYKSWVVVSGTFVDNYSYVWNFWRGKYPQLQVMNEIKTEMYSYQLTFE